jgi:hypothetical protein
MGCCRELFGKRSGAGWLPVQLGRRRRRSSLYRRFHATGLTELIFFPQLTAMTAADPRISALQQQILGRLNPEEAAQWRHVATQAEAEGSFFIAHPHHCVVGIKR